MPTLYLWAIPTNLLQHLLDKWPEPTNIAVKSTITGSIFSRIPSNLYNLLYLYHESSFQVVTIQHI